MSSCRDPQRELISGEDYGTNGEMRHMPATVGVKMLTDRCAPEAVSIPAGGSGPHKAGTLATHHRLTCQMRPAPFRGCWGPSSGPGLDRAGEWRARGAPSTLAHIWSGFTSCGMDTEETEPARMQHRCTTGCKFSFVQPRFVTLITIKSVALA